MNYQVPVEDIQPGDTIILGTQRSVVVEAVDSYPDDTYIVRWRRNDPAHEGGVQHGSLIPVFAGYTWTVAR